MRARTVIEKGKARKGGRQEEEKYGIERKKGLKKKGGERTRQRETTLDSNKIHLTPEKMEESEVADTCVGDP